MHEAVFSNSLRATSLKYIYFKNEWKKICSHSDLNVQKQADYIQIMIQRVVVN